MAPRKPGPRLLSLEEIALLVKRTLESSAADETEIVWLEVQRGMAALRGSQVETRVRPERTVQVRVLDRGRVGSYRTGAAELGELQNAVRMAIAQSRVRKPLSGLPHLPANDREPTLAGRGLYDRALAELSPRKAQKILGGLLKQRESADLDWAEARVAVFNSRDVRRAERVTTASFSVRCGRRPGGGTAADAARSLADLDLEAIVRRARRRHGRGEATEPTMEPAPIVLSPEATVRLIEFLSRVAFSAKAYHDGTSFLREHINVQVFDRALDLVDDATDPAGLPFPFDLEGTAKRRVDLILKGAPKTPTLDQRQAAVLGLPPTAHAIGGNDSQAQNLFLVAGELTERELLEAADGGVWIGGIEGLEVLEPKRVQFRARAVGARRIAGGRLAEPLVDLWWQDSLLRALSDLRGLGRDTARRPTADGFLGGTCAPALAVGGVEGLSPA